MYTNDRAKCPSAVLVRRVPLSQVKQSAILAGLSSYAGGTTSSTMGPATVYKGVGDTKAYLIDYGPLEQLGTSKRWVTDTSGIHPGCLGHAEIAAMDAAVVREIMGGGHRRPCPARSVADSFEEFDMNYKPSDSYVKEFVTSSPTDRRGPQRGFAARGNGRLGGLGTGDVPHRDQPRRRAYSITGTIPSGRVKGDVLNVSVAATVGGVAGKAIVDTQGIDSSASAT